MTTHTTPDDQPLTPTPDTTRDLTEIWDAMGDAGIQPKGVKPITKKSWAYNYGPTGRPDFDLSDCWCRIEPQFALDILTGHAERWLHQSAATRGDAWIISKRNNKVSYGQYLAESSFDLPEVIHHSLPAAIRAECGRGK